MIVHSASIQDRDGAKLLLGPLAGSLPNFQLIWADGGYAGKLIGWIKEFRGWTLEIVKRNADLKRFHVLPHRWIVERTLVG